MNITISQLAYILDRKYQGIRIGIDAIIIGTVIEDVTHPCGFRNNPDATIADWKIPNIPQPTDEELQRLWVILEPQYHSDPLQEDSEMHMFTYFRDWKPQNITVNQDL